MEASSWEINQRRERQNNTLIYDAYTHKPLQINWVYLESFGGRSLAGNLLRIIQELSKAEYGKLEFFSFVQEECLDSTKKLLTNYGLNNITLLTNRTEALVIMEQCKYVLSDSSFPQKFVKRTGQTVVNTWHGTPLKHMGKAVSFERHNLGISQRFFINCDYILAPNDFFYETILQDYMLEGILPGKVINAGYPRNTVFFDSTRQETVRQELGLNNYEVFAYMPTWRGKMEAHYYELAEKDAFHILSEIDCFLSDNQILLFNPHPFLEKSIDYQLFDHIMPFPPEYDPYDVLCAADCLITDYSSVMFDYALTKKRIILFAYDLEQYQEERGLYLNYSELPFPTVTTIPSLIDELLKVKSYDETDFLQTYCPFDSAESTRQLCQHIFLGNKECQEYTAPYKKPNILIHGGSLIKNGMTTAFINLANTLITRNNANYFLSFSTGAIMDTIELLDIVPAHARYIPQMPDYQLTESEYELLETFIHSQEDTPLPQELHAAFIREWKRQYADTTIETVINFDTYSNNNILFFAEAPVKTNAFFVHNDMEKEILEKEYVNKNPLQYAFNTYRRIAVVAPELKASTIRIGCPENNIYVVHNLQEVAGIKQRGSLPFSVDSNTEIVTDKKNNLEAILASNDGPKIITIGRFSPEKEHARLLEAFDLFHKDYPDSHLIIIGGYGVEYEATVTKAKSLESFASITIIKSLSNPLAILAKCDLFVLASSHEGLPMTIAEADILGKPVIATDIDGVHDFMINNHGYLVPNSTEGVLQGLYDYTSGKVKPMNIDWELYNNKALTEFDAMLKGEY